MRERFFQETDPDNGTWWVHEWQPDEDETDETWQEHDPTIPEDEWDDE